MKTAIVNIGTIVTGDLKAPFAAGDAILMQDGRISAVGTLSSEQVSGADVVIDAAGTTAIPGLIDSHVHITFGDYTPRQRVVGYLESYVHGGTTTAITASEVHTPGRPKDPAGVKALALAARSCFLDYRPGGMRVHAGSIILEPGLTEADLDELVKAGVWLAKAGFGAFGSPFDYAPLMLAARERGMVTTMHTGGSSIPGSSGIWAEHVLKSNPTVSFHVNGGPVAMPEHGFARLVNESSIALQLCTAGNLRTALLTAKLLDEAGQPERLLIATDTPTGSGIMPLGMLYTISHLASLGDMPPEQAIAAATGNNATTYRLDNGFLKPGKDADVVLIDACAGGSQDDALAALRNGDVPAVAAVVSDGVPRFVGRSRNTPAGIRNVRVAETKLPRDFSGAAAH
ncbi:MULTISPECIES: amidohydrolase family protein [Rhodopseudomonas]|uniref:Amidohydrolase n=1 Tax=Rhodopseudomonas palustris TaxID=1076 RepID=A0A0D7EPH1_RHOPL|nr:MULTISPECIES: amidohydrolase family protein [Rhodopseudomonas]KIZ42571.1 amidohydrolase [Rhodopseudomonas palustris]MDF3811412.1 amidohydrolase family protein [Rhodopseudomonas sp. BAL398]WOK16291.1 amidohydrolase family protein [Rhodopseudomonas sp. BAL398]